jgi:hypothetical protein
MLEITDVVASSGKDYETGFMAVGDRLYVDKDFTVCVD